MIEDDGKEKEKEEVLKPFQWYVPDCCREGRDDCPHSVPRSRKKKQNVAL